MDIFSIKNKVVIVTGGCGFLGSHVVEYLKKVGANVAVFDLHTENSVDVTDTNSVAAGVDRVVKEYGQIDGLVLGAAIDAIPSKEGRSPQFSPYDEYPVEVWDKAFDVNLKGAQIVVQKVIPHMMAVKEGSVVFIASDLSVIAPNNTIYDEGHFKDIAYATSKAGTVGLARNWATYLGPHNVRSNAISPGGVFNNQPEAFVKKNAALNMLGRMAKPDEYNGLVQFLLSPASSYITGTNIIADGGRSAW